MDGARGDEEPRGDVFVGQALAEEADDVEFGRGERFPPAGRPLAFSAAALRGPAPGKNLTGVTGPTTLPVTTSATEKPKTPY